jgi:hypothetical protein
MWESYKEGPLAIEFNKNELTGKYVARKFFINLFKLFVYGLKNYYTEMPDFDKTHGFMFKEQQTKSFITPAISKLCNYSFLQESPTHRRPNKRYRVNMRYGHVDYWANCGNSSFVIEVKQDWFRYFKNGQEEDKFTIYSSTSDKLNNSIKQIKTVYKKHTFRYRKRLFTISLLVAPVYNYGGKIFINKAITNELVHSIRKLNCNIYGIWKIEKRYCRRNRYKYKGKYYVENYPIVALIGNIKSASKKMN